MRSLAQIALAISVLLLPAAIFIPCGAPSCTDGVLQLSEFLTFAILFGIIIGAVLYLRAPPVKSCSILRHPFHRLGDVAGHPHNRREKPSPRVPRPFQEIPVCSSDLSRLKRTIM